MLPGENGAVTLVESKFTRTPQPAMAKPLLRLAAVFADRAARRGKVASCLVHRSGAATSPTRALAPGAEALTTQEFFERLPL